MRQARAATLLLATGLVTAAAIAVVFGALAPPRSAPPPDDARVQELTATLSGVDRQARALHLAADLLGMFGARVVVTQETVIERAGQRATLEDLHEGMLVDITFERRPLHKIARSIRVVDSVSGAARE